MLLSVIFVVFVCFCSSQGWNVDLKGRYPVPSGQQLVPGVSNTARCFGMSRKTRQQKIRVPLIHNIRTGQSLPFPKFLYSAAPSVIARAEHDGWEVRLTTTYAPRYMYERVPICCPGERNCDHGRQIIISPAADNAATCANGGQMIYRDGQQRCECAPGYQGIWCQFRALPGDSPPHSGFPSGPLVRVLSAPAPYKNMIKEADMWRSKARQFPTSPMLPVREHPAGAASPWAYPAAAMMQHQMMQAKMAQMEEMYRQSHGDFRNQIPPQSATPPDVRRTMAVNPYNVINSGANGRLLSASGASKNPYSAINSQGQLPPDMMRAFYAVQEDLRRKQALNPYSHMPKEVPRPLSSRQNVNGEYAGGNPYNTHPPQGRDVPQARTPWDLDPFGQQQNPSYMNYPGMPAPPNRNKQAMAMVLYRQLLNQQKGELAGRNDAMQRPIVKSVGAPTPAVVPQVNVDTQQKQQQQQQLVDLPREETTQPQQVTVTSIPETTSSNISEQQQPQQPQQPQEQQQMPTNGQPLTAVPGPSPQEQPSSEEMKRIEQCQAVLTPRLSDCLKDYGLVMEQFMNPEYMQKAQTVCQASQSVGQCIMQHDQACGQGDLIMTTRRMINSVLHMMGMICQQITARGEVPVVPGQSQENFVQAPGVGMPVPVPELLAPTGAVPSDGALPPVEKVQEPPMINEYAQQQGEALPKDQTSKPSHVNSVHESRDFTEAPVSKGHKGHDSAHPVSQDLKVLGFPLWLVITVGLGLFVVLLLSVVIICLCCRRISRRKSVDFNKEIEKVPAPLERVCSIGIPPPAYNTTVLQQNDDGLDLPPLDVNDTSVNEDEDEKKVPLEDETDGTKGKETNVKKK